MYQIAVWDDDRADLSRIVRLTRRILDEAAQTMGNFMEQVM